VARFIFTRRLPIRRKPCDLSDTLRQSATHPCITILLKEFSMTPALSRTRKTNRQPAATVVPFPERPPGDSTLWREIVEGLDFALQPIVSIHTGISLGFEVLLRLSEMGAVLAKICSAVSLGGVLMLFRW
jgi:EAL domain-containing protein (putative c-di-GMP-specific phosphodiesterase class I)